MGSKVNLVLDDDVLADLDQMVPSGERSRFATEALRRELTRLSRKLAIEKLAALRSTGPTVTTAEIVQMIREDRDRD
jgi:Arc/MetJ family transcription regulator